MKLLAEPFCCPEAERHLHLHEGGANYPCVWCIEHAEKKSMFGSCKDD
ncbi:hypothetical protein [Streptomyces sp. cg35]